MKKQSVKGEYAYILWTAQIADNVYEMATDTFVVREGKIVAQKVSLFAGVVCGVDSSMGIPSDHLMCIICSR